MFNVRVYGILINEFREVLVSDEWIRGGFYTKFPGGGLEFGEGTRDCLAREFMEEMNLRVEVGAHLYTTDFFQMSAFNPSHQILSIYYQVKALEPIQVPLQTLPFQFDEEKQAQYIRTQEVESFRMIPWEQLTPDQVSLPIDKVVVEIIKSSLSQ
jgi:ADP-ribose pyrophosphatase YjhB (NUDIX family)